MYIIYGKIINSLFCFNSLYEIIIYINLNMLDVRFIKGENTR